MKRLSLRLVLFIFILLATSPTVFGQSGLVISQIYGGGGNSGATYRYDFIELYNGGTSAVDLSTYSIQYASSAGSSWSAIKLTGAIQAGHYFLLRGCVGNTTSTAPDLPATSDFDYPDYNASGCNGNLSGTSGKVALVSNQTPMSGIAANPAAPLAGASCPSTNAGAIVDFVGYGAATCYEGASTAPVMTNTSSDSRSVPPGDLYDDSSFNTLTTPTPHNSSFGAATGGLSALGSAEPAAITAPGSSLLSVVVTSATSPDSTGITVTGDLRQLGAYGQSTSFSPVGDNVYTFSISVTSNVNGAVVLPVTVTDAQGRTANANITLTVTQPTPTVAISAIQGSKSKTATSISPYAGQKVTTQGVVTAILPNAFFIQSATSDGDPTTPEGIEIYTSTKPPTAVMIGTLVSVTGTVATYLPTTETHIPGTEITSPTITALGPATLPAPIALTTNDVSPSGGIYQLSPYEGMRVSFPSLTATSGTDGSLNESSETYTSTGEFYAVITGTPRPFREPGIDLRDPVVDNTKQTAVFDDNPERIFVDSGYLVGATPLNISTGAILPNVTGVLDFTNTYDDSYYPARLFIDPAYNAVGITPGVTIQPVPPPASTEFTVASFNIERFYNTDSADDLYYVPNGVNGYNGSSSKPTVSTGQTFQSEAVDVTPTAYSNRLKKVSLAIRTVLNTPDIVTLEEVENQSVANDIANQINTDAGITDLYTAYSTDNSTYYTQDGTGISVGFLVKNSTVDELGITQHGQGETFTPTSGSLTTLNDRPWLVLNAGLKRTGAKDYPVTVIVNHMKALTGVNSTSTNSTRLKKELQAEDIAKYIQGLQAAGQHVISGGDFNAFEFSDGYTDTLATYTNTNVLPANQVVQPGVSGLVTPPLVDMALNLAPSDRWSYVEDGTAQILDHLVVTPELVAAGAHMVYAHLDADFPVISYNDPTTAARTSDHDAAVGYFTLPAPVLSATLTPASVDFGSNNTIGVASAGHVFTLTNTGDNTVSIASVTATGDYAATSSCGSTLTVTTATCTINVVFTPTAAGIRTSALTVVTSAGTYISMLTGATVATAPPASFTLGDPSGNPTTSATVAAGSSVGVSLTFTPVTGSTNITLSCTGPASAPGISCVSPNSFALSGTPVTQTITFNTTSRTATQSGFALPFGTGSLCAAIAGLSISGFLMLLATRSRRLGHAIMRTGGFLMILFALSLTAIGCSGKPAPPTGTGGNTTTNPNGTPAGIYTYTITATPTSGASHTETVNLTVQ